MSQKRPIKSRDGILEEGVSKNVRLMRHDRTCQVVTKLWPNDRHRAEVSGPPVSTVRGGGAPNDNNMLRDIRGDSGGHSCWVRLACSSLTGLVTLFTRGSDGEKRD